jgi:plastocyanin
VVKSGIIIAIIIGLGVVIGFALIAPIALCCGGDSHAPSPPLVSTIVITEGAALADSGKGFLPPTITVVMGINNTARWVNQDDTAHFIEADYNDSQWFEATRLSRDFSSKNALEPGETFEFTFTKPGEFGYHSVPHPWKHGTVIVLPESGK